MLKAVGGLGGSAGLKLRANRTKGELTRKYGAGGRKGEKRSWWSVVRGPHRILTLWVTKDISVHRNV